VKEHGTAEGVTRPRGRWTETAVVTLLAIAGAACDRAPVTSEPSEPGVPAANAIAAPPPATALARGEIVPAGLKWLQEHQGADGRWIDPATTGFVLMAFLGAGQTHQSGSSRDVVTKALRLLRDGQDADGCLVPRTTSRLLRDHALAGLALTDSFGMTSSEARRKPAERAVAFALKTRTPGGAWNLPAPDDAQIDVEATVWMSMLVKSASLSGLDVDGAVLVEVANALDGITDPATGRVRVPAQAQISEDAATAAGCLVRIWSGRQPQSDALTAKSFDSLLAHVPAADTTDLAYVLLGSSAMLTLGGERFRAWLPSLNAIMSAPSRADGPEKGSWDPRSDDSEAARIVTTAYHLRFCNFYYGAVGHASMQK
jgi:hypothetical protein